MTEPAGPTHSPAPVEGRGSERRWKAFAIAGTAIVIVALLAGAFLPRWWAHRIADQAGGSFTSGILLGLFYGFVFTLLALAAIWVGLRYVRTWKGRTIAVGVALLLAAPNVLTASIVVGWGNAAHAGERTLDVEAPGFRWSTLLGALAAATLALFVGYLVQSRSEARGRAATLEARAGAPPAPERGDADS